jgi:hypothetical protein
MGQVVIVGNSGNMDLFKQFWRYLVLNVREHIMEFSKKTFI